MKTTTESIVSAISDCRNRKKMKRSIDVAAGARRRGPRRRLRYFPAAS
jgi:hypothetical protein